MPTILKEILSAEEFAALAEPFKDAYKLGNDGTYGLQHDGVGKLKTSLDAKDELLRQKDAELETLKRDVAKYADIDPAKAREAMRKITELEGRKLIDKGDYDAALAAEKATWEQKEADLSKKLDGAQKFLEKKFIDGTFREVFTSGKYNGKDLPKVKAGLVDALLLKLRGETSPRLIEVGEDRQALVTVGGRDLKLSDWASEWLLSEAAKDYIEVPVNGGGRTDAAAPNAAPTVKGTLPSTDRARLGASLEQIASGEIAVSG
jgi:hypothetical protein